MNFSALKQELSDRGFSYLSDARLGNFINWARAELDDTDLWPYREAGVTGTAPLAISDLDTIEAVENTTQSVELLPAAWRDLLAFYGDLTTSGAPLYYYLAEPAGVLEVATYPTNSDTIGVQYWRVTPDLSAGTDIPLAPTRFHKTIVDIAVRLAYRDADNHQAAEALQAEIDRDVMRMRTTLGVQQVQGPDFIQVREGW